MFLACSLSIVPGNGDNLMSSGGEPIMNGVILMRKDVLLACGVTMFIGNVRSLVGCVTKLIRGGLKLIGFVTELASIVV
jgi:hypothetical protein